MRAAARKVRVAVLGGGCAGVTAAFRLSDTPEKRARFSVTLYQQGFRLGGKGATGRNAAEGLRIEEHGLHVWMGFYRHAFALARDAYEAWEPPPLAPFRRVEDVFLPHYRVSFVEERDGAAAAPWTLDLPPRPGRPWDRADSADPPVAELLGWVVRGARAASGLALRSPGKAARRAWLLARLAATAARGLATDVVPFGERGFDRMDAYDLRAWLSRHGASPEVADAPPVRAFYDLTFAYPDGRSGPGRGRVAAGAALRCLLRMLFDYRGAPFWKMRLGMGDTVFSPLHQVLERRGVRVALFHRLERIRVAGGGVSALRMRRQARPRGSGAYRPFLDVRGHPCWPAAPQWEQLADGEEARRAGADFEASTCAWGEPIELRRGEHFDAVVLAIPVDAHRRVAAELMESSPAFARMVESARTVATASVQLWLADSLEALGFREGGTILTGFASPFRSMADLGDVLPAEGWQGADRPEALLYLCDAWPDDGEARPRDVAPLRAEVARRLDRLVQLLPGAARDDALDRARLFAAGARGGEERLARQYVRLNTDVSQRYVLSLPGTTAHRLAPSGSGFDNLVLAGDWTRTSINGGSVEAAAESGQRAAEALIERMG